jgi:signal transduction histidine kinase
MRSSLTDSTGRSIPISFRTVGLYDDDQELVGAVEIFYDISQTVALEEERDRTLAYFAHDMKSPLVGAVGLLDRLVNGKVGVFDDKQLEYLNIIRGQLMRVQELVGDYLDVLRLGSNQAKLLLEPLDLGLVLKSLAEFYYQRAKDKGLGWRLEVAEDLPMVMADRGRIARALANLIDNAVKFSEKGVVEVQCSQVSQGNVRILVCDQGPGFSEDDAQKLFTPFFRGSAGKKAEGTGLGLAAVKTILEAHGGEIFASNRQQNGVCFAAILPAAGPGKDALEMPDDQ